MNTTLGCSEQWAQLEFSDVQLGDKRRTQRLVRVASALAQSSSGTLPQALPDWAQLKAAYRLFNTHAVTYERILSPHWQRTAQACAEPGEYLWIEDTTELDYTAHRRVRGMGRIGNDRGVGMLLHSTLALRVEQWCLDHTPEVSVVGLLDQQCWVRDQPPRKGRESRQQLLSRPRESQRWGRVVLEMPPRGDQVTWILIADREGDIYESFERCLSRRTDFIIRAACPRALAAEDQNIFEAVAGAAVLGCFELEVRTRPDQAARTAQLEVRQTWVCLRGVWRPGGRLAPLELKVVEVREINPPAGVQPVHWVLLTSLPCQRFVEARRIVARYARRWLVEEYHKALKTGAQIEKSQLEERRRLEALLGILVLVAVRLLSSKLLARSRPEAAVQPQHFGVEAMQILSARFGVPPGGWTHASLLIALARLGGFLARKGDGMPGWITIWRGWQRLMTMVEGVKSISSGYDRIEATKCG